MIINKTKKTHTDTSHNLRIISTDWETPIARLRATRLRETERERSMRGKRHQRNELLLQHHPDKGGNCKALLSLRVFTNTFCPPLPVCLCNCSLHLISFVSYPLCFVSLQLLAFVLTHLLLRNCCFMSDQPYIISTLCNISTTPPLYKNT